MKVRNISSSGSYFQKLLNQLFDISKSLFPQKAFNVVFYMQLIFIGVITLSLVDIILGITIESNQWHYFGFEIAQIVVSILAIFLVSRWPLLNNIINQASCIAINTLWAINMFYFWKNSSQERRSEGISYCIGMLSFMMVSNSKNFGLKFGIFTINVSIFCSLSNSPVRSIHYLIVTIIAALFYFIYDQKGNDKLFQEIQQMHCFQDALPQAILVVEKDQKENIKLSFSNEKSKKLFKLRDSNIEDLCKSIMILKKMQSSQARGYNTNIKKSKLKKKYNETPFSLDEEESQKNCFKQMNLFTFLQQKFKEIQQNLNDNVNKQSPFETPSFQLSNKKHAFVPQILTDFNIQASSPKQNITQSIQAIPFEKRIFMLSQQAAFKQKESNICEEFECSLSYNSDIWQDEGRIKLCLQIGVSQLAQQNQIVMSFSQIHERENTEQQECKCSEFKNVEKLFFYEEFCKQSLLKSTRAIFSVVQEVKALVGRASVITEVELSRFLNSNIYSVDSSLSNNLKISSIPNIGTQTISFSTNPTTSATQKGVYCVPKRQLDNALQLCLQASSIVTNYTNYFAIKSLGRNDLETKTCSLLQIIKNVQNIFKRLIDSKSLQILLSVHEDLQENLKQSKPTQTVLPAASSLSLSNISIHNLTAGNINGNINQPNGNLNLLSTQQASSISGALQSQQAQLQQTAQHQALIVSSCSNLLIPQRKSQSLSQTQLQVLQDKFPPPHQQIAPSTQVQNIPPKPQVGGVWYQGLKGIDEVKNDESLVQHIIFILFQNAVENTPVNGTIAISLSRDSDGIYDDGFKIRIRNKCASDYFFPFLNSQKERITLNWREMIKEYKQSGKFYFSIRMASQLANLVGPENSLIFKNISGKELQAEFRIENMIQRPINFIGAKESLIQFDHLSDEQDKMSSSFPAKPTGRNYGVKRQSTSSCRVELDSVESFDKWIKIQSLEQQKGQNTMKIRTQLKFKN